MIRKFIYFIILFILSSSAIATEHFTNRWHSNVRLEFAGNSQWIIRERSGFVNICQNNRRCLHIENGSLQLGEIQDGWYSAQWSLNSSSNGFVRIRNRWRTDQYLHIENGNLQSGRIQNNWHSAQWRRVAGGGTGGSSTGGTGSGGSNTDDHGNSTSSATNVNSSSTTSGRIERGGDSDYFRISIPSSGTLTINSTGSLDTYGYLLNSSGNVITRNDDGGSGTNFRISSSVTRGTYYVKVRAYSSQGTGNYRFVSSFSSGGGGTGGTGSYAPT